MAGGGIRLESDIKAVKGVGDRRARLLAAEMGVATVADLLFYFPFRHIDRGKVFPIAQIPPTEAYIQFRGRIVSFDEPAQRGRPLRARVTDGTGTAEAVWFAGQAWAKANYRVGADYLFFGRPTLFNGRVSVAHPEVEPFEAYFARHDYTFAPIYTIPERAKKGGVTVKVFRQWVEWALKALDAPLPDFYPPSFAAAHHLPGLDQAVRWVHFPPSHDELARARERLKFDELFLLQLELLRQFRGRRRAGDGLRMPAVGPLFNDFYRRRLPFALTGAQKRVTREIFENMRGGVQMNRLLQGDVGSGKTLVALMSALLAAGNGFQSCLMAPTEILARQHHQSIARMVGDLPFNVGLLTGSTRKKERAELLGHLAGGALHLLVGTHALIEDPVVFKDLGLVIVDEQHRFGVAQRARLWRKGRRTPHVLVVTATPIPRTLAMTIYGDLDVSVIDELPPGRKPIRTLHFFDDDRGRLDAFLREQVAAGRQAYIVFPLIEESERVDYKNLEEGYRRACREFGQGSVVMVHGRMKADEKAEAMSRFAAGQARVMVATTVIEVGVDVPNATVMVIESAERFGLSQLHQLRGRVGRGAEQSYCALLTPRRVSDDGRRRVGVLTSTNDGFAIAEEDLKIRGYGDIEGTRQSGLPFELRMASLSRDQELLARARAAATRLLDADPLLELPEHRPLARHLRYKTRAEGGWGQIS